MLDSKTLIEAIEKSDCMLPEIEGYNEYISLPGVLLCVSPTNDPHANKAMNARLSGENADTVIAQVKEFFAKKGKTFSWIVGPNSTPPDLGGRLLRQGFEEMLRADGLYLPNLQLQIEPNNAVRIVELPPDDLRPAVPIMAVGFDVPIEVSRIFHEMITLSAPAVLTRTYVAFLDGVDHPVACGYTTYYPDQPIALLCGGATLPECRGRGLYRSMLAHRLSDIRRDGIEAVIVLADQKTSSPICIKYGFERLCELQFYMMQSPQDQSS